MLAERLSHIFDDKQHRLVHEHVGQIPLPSWQRKPASVREQYHGSGSRGSKPGR